jgi:hypothetical protein
MQMKTAVEWFYEEIWKQFGFSCSSNILEKAKEMEKDQIMDARVNGVIRGIDICDFPTKESLHEEHLKYYNETFKSE